MIIWQGLLPLAHGALGYLDEIAPLAIIGVMAALFVIFGFMSRKRETPADSAESNAGQGTAGPQGEPTAPDHYRLD